MLILPNIRLLTIIFLHHLATVRYTQIMTLLIKFWISTWKSNFKDIHQLLWKAYFTTKEIHTPTGLHHSEFQ